MARFKNSNRMAAEQVARTTRNPLNAAAPRIEKSYFERLGFDAAMI